MINKVIGNYKIISELGRGGMGVVYKAYDLKLKRNVALKILKPEMVRNSKFISRFKQEAQNQAQLSHANIAPVYGLMEEKNAFGIIMEYVEGETLESIINHDIRLHYLDVIFLIKQVLAAVDYAHSKGLIHRDIKPSNIIVNDEGLAKLMDFGISKSVFDKDHTSPGRNVGTLLYMSPEQIRNEEPTPQSDIYSVGITLYEMLAGNTPFDYMDEHEITESHLNKEPPGLKAAAPEIPEWLELVVNQALRKNPLERFASAREMISVIENNEKLMNECELNNTTDLKFSNPSIQKLREKRKSLSYKIVTSLISLSVFSLLCLFVYYVTGQVLNLWEKGEGPLFSLFKKGQKQELVREQYYRNFQILAIKTNVSENLNSMTFVNDSLVFACGNNGTLIESDHNLKLWKSIKLDFSGNMNDIVFLKNGRGIISCDSSVIFITNDFGKNWRKNNLKYSKTLLSITFCNDGKTGFITGNKGLLLKTIDAGETWYPVVSNTNNSIYNIEFASENKFFAVDRDGKILKSSDKGESWMKIPDFSSSYLKSIKFFSNNTGLAVGGAGEILKTTDSGESWKKIATPVQYAMFDICSLNKYSFISAAGGKIFISSDNGENWQILKTGSYFPVNRFTHSPAGIIYGCGSNGSILEIKLNNK